jgi:hypothetical protein
MYLCIGKVDRWMTRFCIAARGLFDFCAGGWTISIFKGRASGTESLEEGVCKRANGEQCRQAAGGATFRGIGLLLDLAAKPACAAGLSFTVPIRL